LVVPHTASGKVRSRSRRRIRRRAADRGDARPTTEEVAEQIAERGEDVVDVREPAAAARAAAPADAFEAVPVVARALIVVAQDLVGGSPLP